ncbi:MAG: hypothetical protein C0598_06555, partial [Marinilabiliales bacterium]
MKSFFKILSIVIFTGLFQFGTCDFEDVEDTTPTQSMTDSRDGKQYKTVQIGSQVWMAENLNYYHLESWYYNNDSISNYDYGRLYKWGTAKLVCPSGWHLPSDDEWKELEMALGMSQAEADQTGLRGSDQANQLKSTYGWDQNSGTNSSGFNAFPAGWRHSLGGDKFYMIGTLAYFWSSTPNNINSGAMVRKLDALDGRIDR